MKKIFILLSLFMILPVVVSANTYYVNYNGIEMSEEDYSNLLELGFTEEEIYYLTLEEFTNNKDVVGNLEATTTRYFAHIVRYSSTGQFISETDMEIDEASYNSEVVMPRGDGYIETTYKQLRTTISKVNSLYRFKVSLVWKQMPAKRSYDIIGIGYDPYVSVSGSLVFSQNSCVSTNCTSTSTRNSTSINTNGSGVSFKLPTSTSITTLSSYLYFNITKTNSSDTITAMYAYGDYAHATSTITGGNAQGFYVNQAGIMIADSIKSYYDTIQAANALWTGTW